MVRPPTEPEIEDESEAENEVPLLVLKYNDVELQRFALQNAVCLIGHRRRLGPGRGFGHQFDHGPAVAAADVQLRGDARGTEPHVALAVALGRRGDPPGAPAGGRRGRRGHPQGPILSRMCSPWLPNW